MFFRGKQKRLVLNKTNAKTIAGLYGDDTEGWIGKRITLVVREVEFEGSIVLAIRVSGRIPQPKPPETPAASEPVPASSHGTAADHTGA